MGASLSSQTKAETKLKKTVDEQYLLPRNLFVFFEQFTRKQMKPNKTDAKVEPALFSIIIDQILLYQNAPCHLQLPMNLESRIFDAIAFQINSFITQANPFADRYRFIEDNMENQIQAEILKAETDWKQNAKSLIFDINSSMQTPTVLHASFSVFFQVANVPNFEKLSIESVDLLLENLNQLVTSPDCPDLLGTSPHLISKFNSFIVNLALSPKFAKNQIKSKVITFLLHISTIQGGIYTVLAALTVGMSVQALTPFEGISPVLRISTANSLEPLEVGPLFGTPVPVDIQTNLYSACAVSINTNLLLVTQRGILEVNQSGRILQTREIKDPQDILITSSTDYIIAFNLKTFNFLVFNYSDISLSFEVALDSIIETKRTVIGIAFCTYLFVLVETSFYEYDLLGFSIDKKTICFQFKEHLKLSAEPKFIFPGKKSVYLHCGDLLLCCDVPSTAKDKNLKKISYKPNRVINEPDSIVTSSSNCAYVIKSNGKNITITHYPINYGDVIPFPEFAKHFPTVAPLTFNSFLVNTISDMTPQLYQTVQYVFQKVTPATSNLLQYFAASPKDTINFALNLGQQSLNSVIFPQVTRQQILFFSLMLLTINGRCFISQFPLNQFEIEESDSILLNQIKSFVETAVFHPIATPEIIAAAFQTIKATFRFLYFPNYGQFRQFLNGFKPNPKLLAVSLPFLRGSSALFYAVDSELLLLVSAYLTHKNLHYIFHDRISDINNELHFLKANNITSHEKYIANFISALINYYTDRICFPELFSRMQKSVTMILRIFTRVLVLDSAPIVSVSFAEACLRLLESVKSNFTATSKDISTDLEFSSVPDANETTQKKIETIETPHNYEDGKDIEWKIEMNGASEIEIEFDQKCATERNTDYLQIYDRAEGGSLFGKNLTGPAGPLNWPKKVTIPSDSCRLAFHADESTNDWGISCTISAHVPVATRQFKPDICLSMVNLICYAIGRSLQQALISIPIVELEKEYKLMLESNILKGSSSVFNEQIIEQMSDQVQLLISSVNKPTDQKANYVTDVNKGRPNRSKSERTFEELTTNATPHPNTVVVDESRHSLLLTDLTSLTLDNGTPAALLLQTLYKASHATLIKQMPLSSVVERFAFAALIRQLGLLGICSSTAMELVQSTANPSGPARPPIPMNLSRLIKSIYKIRTVLHSAYQKSKVENRNPNSLRENYLQFATEMLLKSKYLLISEPLLKGREMSHESSFEPALDSLVSFIVSDVKFCDIQKMVEIRVKRAQTRIKAMDIVAEFIKLEDLFNTARISFLAPLINAFPAVVDKTNIKSISLELMDDYDEHCSAIHKLFIDTISSPNIPNALRLFLLRFLLFPTQLMANEENNLKSLLTFLSSFLPKTIDEIAFAEGLWLFLSNIAIQNRSEDLCKFLNELSMTNINEYFRTKVITLQTVMVMDGFYKFINLQDIFDMMKGATPRLIVAILRFIAAYFYTFGVSDSFSVVFCEMKLNFSEFAEFLLRFISKTQIYETLPILPDTLPIESHQFVANEIVSFFRQLISRKSKAHAKLVKELQKIFTSISDVPSIDQLFENRKLSLDFLSLLIIFGNGIQPLFQGGYGVFITGPSKDDVMKITAYSSLANIVTGITLSKSFVANSISPETISSASRIPPNPRHFDFLENHFVFFERFHEFCLLALRSNQVYRDHRLLFGVISAFYCFMPMAIQSAPTMLMFLKTADITKWLEFSVEKTNETTLNSISELSLAINDRIQTLAIPENDKDLNTIGENEPKTPRFEKTPEYLFDALLNANAQKTHLQFSILPSNERNFSPSKMVVLFGNGEVNDMVASTNSVALFVGDRTVPSQTQFYWEAKILTNNNNSNAAKFSIGFIDSREPTKPYETFALSLPSREIVSPTIGVVKLDEPFNVQSGDVFGIALAQSHIYFFRNGIKISRSIPSPHLGSFSPFLSVNGNELQFEYNFGQNHFKTEFTREQIFDFCGECFIGINSKLNFSTTKFTTSSLEDCEYKSVIEKGVVVLESPRNSEFSNRNSLPNLYEKVADDSDSPLTFVMKPSPNSNCIRVAKGSPVLVQRIHLTPKEVAPNELILFSTTMKEKLGQIGVVRELFPKESSYFAILDFCDPGVGIVESLKFDSRFLTYLPVRKNLSTSFGQSPLIEPSALHRNVRSLSLAVHSSSILAPVLTELNSLTRALSVRMARFSMLLVLDYLRTRSKDFSAFNSKNIVSLLSILILELTNFSPSIHIKSKYSHVHVGDSVFSDPTASPILVVDPSKMSRVLRMVMLSIYVDKKQSQLIPSLFQIVLDTFASSADSAETLFFETPPELRFESTHPCNKVAISHTVNDPNAVGFVPIITSNCQMPNPGITVANIQVTGQQDDIRFIDGQKCELSGDVTQNTNFKGLSLALVPIRRRLCDSTSKTSRGAVHLTFSLLSLIFSFNTTYFNEGICKYMKTHLLPSFLHILKDGGVLGSVFAFEFIAPLLSHLEWSAGDLTDSTLDLIHDYLKKFEDSVVEWKKLSVAAQHATLLKMLFDLTNIDASTRIIAKSPITNSEECRKDLLFFYHTLDTKLHMKPSCIFHEVTDAFTLVAALAHNWSFPIKFPSFLLLDSFLSSVQTDPVVTITDYTGFDQPQNGKQSMLIEVKDAEIISVDFDGIEGATITDSNNNEILTSKGQSTRVCGCSFTLTLPIDCKEFKIEVHVQKLTPEGRENLFISHIESFINLCDFMEKKWNQKIDETLLKIMNQNPQLSNDKNRFKLSHTQLASNSVLHDVPPPLLTARVELIKQLNNSVTPLLKCVDLGDSQVLSAAVIAAKSAIATSYKLDLFRRRVMTHLDEDPRLNLQFNRSRAALHMSDPTHPDAIPLIKQLIDQVPKRSLNALKRDSVPWHVDLRGEGATDAGGPARDLFSQTCLEIMHPSTGLFIMTPNKRAMEGPNQELLIPNSHATSVVQQQMFIYSGVLMTIAFISRLPQPFKFAEFVWAHFTGAAMTIEDIYTDDKPFETLMRQIERGEIDDAELEKRGLTFTVFDSHGDAIELFPGGSGVRVTAERLPEYSQMCKKYRLREMKQQLDWLKEGISYFFPPDALFLLSPWELELIVCGDNTVPVSELKKHCRFDSKDKSSKMLWQVLESFSAEERMLFIKFATGRMGLPPPGSKWHSDLTITWVQSNVRDDAAMPLPTAATCSSTIRIPRYSTEEWMARKIRAAIVFGVDIDTDRQVNFADIVQLS